MRVPEIRRFVLPAALALLVVGVAAWLIALDASPRPFLPEDAVAEKDEVARLFPAAAPVVVRVVIEGEGTTSVLSPDALAAIAGLRNAIRSDPVVARVLTADDPVSSVLTPLERRLTTAPGEWTERSIGSAIENVTSTSAGRRAVAAFLDDDARIAGTGSRARATVLIVHLSAAAQGHDRRDAEERIGALSEQLEGRSIRTSTHGPWLATQAARSPLALWFPAVALAVGVAAALAAGLVRPWTAALAAGVGAGLLACAASRTAVPQALVAAVAGAVVGCAAAASGRARWMPVLVALPFLALARWAPSGLDGLALAAGVAAASAVVAMAFVPVEPRPLVRPPGSRPAAIAVSVAVLALAVAAFALSALPDDVQEGWSGALPPRTGAGRAEAALAEHFGGGLPGASLAIAAHGPVTEPGFLAALDEAGERLERLSLAPTAGPPTTVLTLARDWATDDRGQEFGDAYNARFASLWENATRGGATPRGDVATVLFELRQLDPIGVDRVLSVDGALEPGATGAALLLQRVSLPDVAAHPGRTIDAVLAPLVAASGRVSIGGSALDDDRATRALAAAEPVVLIVALLASGVAAMAWVARGSASLALGLGAVAPVAASVLATSALFDLLGLAATPLTLVALPLAGAASCALAAPIALAGAARAREAGSPEPDLRSTWIGAAWPAALALPVAGLAAAATPATAFREAGLALLVAVGAVCIVTPLALGGLVLEWARSPRATSPAMFPRPAHGRCPVCERPTATGASRCRQCGRWNLVEACPAHADATSATCVECGTGLDAPHFG